MKAFRHDVLCFETSSILFRHDVVDRHLLKVIFFQIVRQESLRDFIRLWLIRNDNTVQGIHLPNLTLILSQDVFRLFRIYPAVRGCVHREGQSLPLRELFFTSR
jgi:hypothetical protein